jgi:hypothetical protein
MHSYGMRIIIVKLCSTESHIPKGMRMDISIIEYLTEMWVKGNPSWGVQGLARRIHA